MELAFVGFHGSTCTPALCKDIRRLYQPLPDEDEEENKCSDPLSDSDIEERRDREVEWRLWQPVLAEKVAQPRQATEGLDMGAVGGSGLFHFVRCLPPVHFEVQVLKYGGKTACNPPSPLRKAVLKRYWIHLGKA